MKRWYFVIPVFALILLGLGCGGAVQENNQGDGGDDGAAVAESETVEDTTMKDGGEEINIIENEKEETMSDQLTFPGILSEGEINNKQIHMVTEKGDIVFELFADSAPLTVSNFVYLTNRGYYDDLTFHRREEGFVIQGGDPEGTGRGGPGYKFEDELSDNHSYDKGIVAMANSGPDTNGSQFFIMLEDYPLPKNYSIFGKVTSGIEVVDQIEIGDIMTTVTVEDAS
jgi:cyclophilin family peptidyl-prolyl cis-trans isomerase